MTPGRDETTPPETGWTPIGNALHAPIGTPLPMHPEPLDPAAIMAAHKADPFGDCIACTGACQHCQADHAHPCEAYLCAERLQFVYVAVWTEVRRQSHMRGSADYGLSVVSDALKGLPPHHVRTAEASSPDPKES